MKKKTLILSALLLLLGNSALAFADEIDSKIKKQDDKINELNHSKGKVAEELEKLEKEIETLEKERQKVLDSKIKNEKELNQINEDIQELTIKIDKRKDSIGKQARNAQLNKEESSFIHIVVNSDSIADAVGKTIAMNQIVSSNKTTMELQQADQKELRQLEQDVKSTLQKINDQTVVLEEKNQDLVESQLEMNIKEHELSASLATEEQTRGDFLKQKEEAERKKQEQLKILAEQKRQEEAIIAKVAEEAKVAKESKEQQTVQPDVSENKLPSTSSGWGAPLASLYVSSPFGSRESPTGNGGNYHNGVDFGAPTGTSIFASRGGNVVAAGFNASAGNHVIIDHGDGYYSYYMHMSQLIASSGQTVSQGQVIGLVGSTGDSTGPHLHFGIATSALWTGYINPAPLLGI